MPPLCVRSWSVGLPTGAVGRRVRTVQPIRNLDIIAKGADVLTLQEVGTWYDPVPEDRTAQSSW